MKKNNKANVVINFILAGMLIGAVLSFPIIFLAIEFKMSLLLGILVSMAFFGTVLPLSAVSMSAFENDVLNGLRSGEG